MSAHFITATGTDIGKTFVTAGLIAALRRAGRAPRALKPVMSGYDPDDPAGCDAALILEALGQPVTAARIEAIAPWRYAAPLSPDMAARIERRPIDVDALIAHCRRMIDAAPDGLLIEGVGGVMVPLDDQRTVADWMAALGLPTILVAGSYLGTLSHTLTALDVLARRGIGARAVIVNESPAANVPLGETIETLARHGAPVPVLSLRRHAGQAAFDDLARALEL